MTRRTILLALSALPALVGFLVWLATFVLGWIPDAVVFFRVSLGYILLFLGLLLSAILGGYLALVMSMERRGQATLGQAQEEAALRHRQFLLRLDHELKNPLTALQLQAANLEAANLPVGETRLEAGQVAEQVQATGQVKEQVQRLNELVIQLRKLAELETRPIEREPVDLAEILREIVIEFQSTPEGAQRELSLSLSEVPWPLPKIPGDADLLYLAIRNVVSNAVKYTRPGDTIQVRAYEDTHRAILEVADTGPGIPEEEQPYVWEELFRGKQARGTPGSGLGLALVKIIIERHGGQVTLRSRPGHGTVVTLRLPSNL